MIPAGLFGKMTMLSGAMFGDVSIADDDASAKPPSVMCWMLPGHRVLSWMVLHRAMECRFFR